MKKLLLIALLVVGLISGCGGGSQVITMTLTGGMVTLQAGGTSQITATVANDAANKGVTWSVSCTTAPCGAVAPTTTPSGTPTTYTAPPNPPASSVTVTITATSVADSSKTATTTITIPAITVSVAPLTPTVLAGNTQSFTGTVQNTGNVGVTWKLTQGGNPCSPGCGTLSSTTTNPATYTAPGPPASNLTVTITATSAADTTKSGSATITVPAITVAVSPGSANVPVRGTQNFTATVGNDAGNKGVTWTLTQGGTACSPACGAIAPAATLSGAPATYTAPATLPANPTVTITATSVSDTSKSNSATATVVGITVSVTPPTASVAVSAGQQFIATVANDVTSSGVTWTLTQAGTPCSPTCGTIAPTTTASGTPTTYTAPATVPTPATVTVTATSVADSTRSGTAIVTVTPPPPVSVSVSPTSANVPVNGAQQFTATVQNTPNTNVTWSLTQGGVACSPTCGTLSSTTANPVTYTAPASVPNPATVTLTATSVADATKSAFATITITVTISSPCGTGSESKLNGQYAFLLQGFDASGPVAVAGSFTADGTGKITAGQEDINRSASAPTNPAITTAGSSYSVGADNRGCLTIVAGGTTSIYRLALGLLTSGVAAKAHIVEFDATGVNLVGVIEKQDLTAFSVAQFSGDYAFGAASSKAGGGRFAVAGRFTASGGALTAVVADTDDRGTPQAIPSFAGTYTVAANGRGTITLTPGGTPVHASFYIVSASEALLMSIDPQTGVGANSLFAGSALRQVGGPFGISSLNGTDVITVEGLGSPASTSDVQVGLLVPAGNGNFTFSIDENNAGTITSNPGSGSYSVAGNGRVVLTNAGTNPPVIYLVSQDKGFLVGTDTSVETGFFEPQVGTTFTNASLSGSFIFGDMAPVVSSSSLNTGIASPNGATPGTISGTSDNNSSGTLTAGQAFTATYSVASNGRVTITSGTDTNVMFIVSSSKAVFISTKAGNANSTITVVEK